MRQPARSTAEIATVRSCTSALSRPPPGSNRPVAASKPEAASCAATTPSIAAFPAWNGFAIVPKEAVSPAVCVAAAPTAGLTASFGTMAKPFHAGKAAMDGVVAAQLAASGFEAATGLFEPGGGLDNALVQDRTVAISAVDLAGWRILENSFKPYAACHLTHPAVDAARALAPGAADQRAITAVRAEIGALAEQVTGGKS